MSGNTNEGKCLRCVLKHCLNAKTLYMESVQFGANNCVSTKEFDAIILKLANFILNERGK